MKNILLILLLFTTHLLFAQVNSVLPPEASTFYEKAMVTIKPEIKTLIEKNANKLRLRKINTDSLLKELHKSPLLKHALKNELEAITVLILVQASIYADGDLKKLVIGLHRSNSEKSSSEENEISKNKTELILRDKSEIAESVATIMKKISGTQQTVMDKYK